MPHQHEREMTSSAQVKKIKRLIHAKKAPGYEAATLKRLEATRPAGEWTPGQGCAYRGGFPV